MPDTALFVSVAILANRANTYIEEAGKNGDYTAEVPGD